MPSFSPGPTPEEHKKPLASAALSPVRPFNIYVPVVMLTLCAIQDLRLRRFGGSWRQLALATGAIYLPLVAYMTGNLAVNNFFGISNVTNLNEFGKVLEYRLYDETNDPAYATIKADVDAYAAQSPPTVRLDPFIFIYVLHPEYQRDGIGTLGKYSRSILLSHLGTVLPNVADDLAYAVNPTIVLFPASNLHTLQGTENVKTHPSLQYSASWKSAILRLNGYEYWVYLLLPLVVILIGIWWWRRPASVALPVLFALALCIVGGVLITGILSYDRLEASRLRFPFDWGMFLLVAILAVEGWVRLAARLRKEELDAQPARELVGVSAQNKEYSMRSGA
ncbi:MAG: hypothetical protein H0X24_14840 [Ktedonobacterales bacterium]|nr:hypothetical protein [Ktedonobacterales bacterium]